jgi:hypothetical protein
MRVVRQPRRLHRGLAELAGLGQPSLHLVGVALDQHHRHQQATLARRASDGHAAVRARYRVVVALQVVLGPAEVVKRLQPWRQLGVRQPIDLRQRRVAVPARLRDRARSRLAEGQRRGGRGHQRPVAQNLRRVEGGPAHGLRLVEVHLVQAVHGQLDLKRHSRGGGFGRQLLPGAGEAGVSLVVAAHPVLHGGAQRDQLQPPLVGSWGQ